jgi:hypothetical protein
VDAWDYFFLGVIGLGLIMLGIRTFRAYRQGQQDAERERKRRRRKRGGPLP